MSSFTYQYFSDNLSKLREAIDHLNYLNDASRIIESQSGYEAIFLIAKYVAFQTNNISYEIFFDKGMHQIYGNILYRLYELYPTYDFTKDKISASNPTPEANYNEKCITTFCMTTYACNLIMSNLLKFKLYFQKSRGLEAYLKMLGDASFVEKNVNLTMNPFNSAVLYIIDYLTLNLSSLSINCQDYKEIWYDLNSVNILLKIQRIRPTAKDYCLNTILNVATDKQLETLTEIEEYSENLLEKVKKMASELNSGKEERQQRQILSENGVTKVNIICTKDSNKIFTSYIVVFNGLYNLSINDKLKLKIYSLKNEFKIILSKGTDWEKHYCLKLIAQISINESIAYDMRQDLQFKQKIQDLASLNNSIFKKFCDQINWNMKEKPKESETQNQNLSSSVQNSSKNSQHIMISYNTASRELCLKIKENLESFGYKVWIDVNDIHGSSLDSMARAVENSFCVLMCVTEKYRQSVNCQAEAQYAFRINKPIIPLIMQKGYESVSGWLGIIMGDKIFVNFMKYSFEECIRRLKGEVESKLGQSTVTEGKHAQVMSKISPENMTNDDVKTWFSNNNIDSLIVNYLSTCDGLVLKQLYDMKQINPQFYDQSFSKIENINMISILKFNAALEKLFA
jgi:hypothetical protein